MEQLIDENWKSSLSKLLKEELIARQTSDSSYSQNKFAEDLGLQKSQLSALINKGNKRPSIDVMYRIATEMNVSIDYLLGLSKIRTTNPTREMMKVSELSDLLNIPYRVAHNLINIYLKDDTRQTFINLLYNPIALRPFIKCIEEYYDFDEYETNSAEFTYKWISNNNLHKKTITLSADGLERFYQSNVLESVKKMKESSPEEEEHLNNAIGYAEQMVKYLQEDMDKVKTFGYSEITKGIFDLYTDIAPDVDDEDHIKEYIDVCLEIIDDHIHDEKERLDMLKKTLESRHFMDETNDFWVDYLKKANGDI
ncbi:MAG: helix-turn-helix transcriptional regulator [Erysipelotrichaceae bacterium]|nr:helix-turn-helix transcriptional regulator [Erysipelotrichaceae bacterium]